MIAKRKRMSVAVSMSAAVFLGLAVSASAHGFGRGGPGGGGPRGPRGGLVQRLIFPCTGDCLDAARSCHETAEAALLTCAAESCDAAIQAARTACGADADSTACRDARSTLVECVQPCLESGRPELSACRTTTEECIDACNGSTDQ